MHPNSSTSTRPNRSIVRVAVIGCCCVLALIGGVFLAIVLMTGGFPPPRPVMSARIAVPVGPDRVTAIDLCHQQMLLALRSPSEAKFPGWSAAKVTIDGNEVLVRDYVDAPNAFGTTVRTNFRCEVHVDAGTDMHRIVDFQVLN